MTKVTETIDINANNSDRSSGYATAPMHNIIEPIKVSQFLKLTDSLDSSEETRRIDCQKGSLKSMTI